MVEVQVWVVPSRMESGWFALVYVCVFVCLCEWVCLCMHACVHKCAFL